MMKNALVFVFCLILVLANAQNNIVANPGFAQTDGPPTFVSGARGSIVALDTVSGKWYVNTYRAGSNWVIIGDRLQTITGCAAPTGVPNKWLSEFVVNECATPEMYIHTGGGTWVCLNCASSGATNLTFTGGSSPYTLNSSTGSDVTISAGANVTLTRVGNDLEIASSGGGGTVTTDATLDGDGSGGDPLKIAQQGAATSQVMEWTGATWEPSWGNPYTFVTTGATITSDVNEVLIGTVVAGVTMGLPVCDATTSGKRFKFVKNGADFFGITIEPNGSQQFYPAIDRIVQFGAVSIDCTCTLVSGTYFWLYDNF